MLGNSSTATGGIYDLEGRYRRHLEYIYIVIGLSDVFISYLLYFFQYSDLSANLPLLLSLHFISAA